MMINIGLIDVDSHNFPNLALMKISAWHKNQGDAVEFATMFGQYDLIYKSKVFSFTSDNEYIYKCDKYIAGGTGYGFTDLWLENKVVHVCPDYQLYNCDQAYGFLTRGCIRNCSWCIVPEKEGKISAHADIEEFLSNKKSAVLMDNNVLAHGHGIEQIEKIIKLKIKIDFNQGLDCRLVDNTIAKLLSQVKWIKYIRFSCDNNSQKKQIENTVKLLNKYGIPASRIFVYMLINDVEESTERAYFLRSLYVSPFGQPYRDMKNTPPTWEQKKLARYINIKPAFKTMSFEKFKRLGY